MLYRFGQRMGCVKAPAEPCFASLRRCKQLHAQQRAMGGLDGGQRAAVLVRGVVMLGPIQPARGATRTWRKPLLLGHPLFCTCVASSCEAHSTRPLVWTWIASASGSFSSSLHPVLPSLVATVRIQPPVCGPCGLESNRASKFRRDSFLLLYHAHTSPITSHLVRPDVVSRAEHRQCHRLPAPDVLCCHLVRAHHALVELRHCSWWGAAAVIRPHEHKSVGILSGPRTLELILGCRFCYVYGQWA
ncbi:hypothetical protein DE146DRAFT_435241 [Phaeosphaeria sp. MPI-PUGE-AT-0046c]|nr:hypothetical protein DE146DRAFT_435241 [Phaeosphaeria sp. MPI-PUGE-AT-0046c]